VVRSPHFRWRHDTVSKGRALPWAPRLWRRLPASIATKVGRRSSIHPVMWRHYPPFYHQFPLEHWFTEWRGHWVRRESPRSSRSDSAASYGATDTLLTTAYRQRSFLPLQKMLPRGGTVAYPATPASHHSRRGRDRSARPLYDLDRATMSLISIGARRSQAGRTQFVVAQSYGNPADMGECRSSQQSKDTVIEDAAQGEGNAER